jgi:hypothetical protein
MKDIRYSYQKISARPLASAMGYGSISIHFFLMITSLPYKIKTSLVTMLFEISKCGWHFQEVP